MKAVLLVAALGLAACSTTGSSTVLPGGDSVSGGARSTQNILGGAPAATSNVNLALFDAPIAGMPGVKVNIGIDGYQLDTPLGGTVPFITNAQPQIINLLDLAHSSQNSSAKAPLGAYSGVRMLIDAASSNVQIGNFKIPIYWGTPGNVTTSPVVAIDFPSTFAVTGIGAAPTITMDFNVYESVRFANNAIYVKPNVSASSAAASVSGRVENAAGKNVANATVLAVGPLGNVVNSTFTGNDGKWTIHALPPGEYTIQVKNSYTTATGDTLTATNADAGAAPTTITVLAPNENVTLPDITD